MRGTDSQVYCDNTNRLRLGLLMHVLDLCKWASSCCRILLFLVEYCLWLLFRLLHFKKQLFGREDYGSHCYMQNCRFVYCLLSRTRQVFELSDLHDWGILQKMNYLRRSTPQTLC